MLKNFFKVTIMNVSFSNYGFVIFLKREGEEKVLPICVGAAEVNSISAALSDQKFPRPLSHTLFKNILTQLGYTIPKVLITELKEGTFYGMLFLKKDSTLLEFDARPSDAIALALRYNAPIYVHKRVFKESAVLMPEAKETENDKENEDASSPIAGLKKKLEKAVKNEEYEEAIRLREKIQQMEMDDLLNN